MLEYPMCFIGSLSVLSRRADHGAASLSETHRPPGDNGGVNRLRRASARRRAAAAPIPGSATMRPIPMLRFLNAFACLVGGLLAVGLATELPEAVGPFAGIVALAAGLVVAVRAYRMAVILGERDIVVRGLFRSRRIDRSAVLYVSAHPALRWRDARGRVRWTPLTMFYDSGRTLPRFKRYLDEPADELARRLGVPRA